jgi:hypothetical protein
VFRPSTRGEACAGWIAYIVAEQPRAARKSQAARGRSTSKARMK